MDIIGVTPPGDTPIHTRILQGYPKGMQIGCTSNSFT